jgi:phosphoglycolate phosphatase
MTFSAPTRLYPARPRAIVFDLDGTLVDTALDLGRALNALLAEYSRPTVSLNDIRHMVGDGAAKLVERGFGATGGLPKPLPDLAKRFVEIYGAGVADESRPFPGVVETLERCRAAGIGLGVCTNKPTGLSKSLLDALDLTRFFSSVAGGDGPVRKPDPAHLLGVVRELKAEPETALMVGDSTNDVQAARNAKMKVVIVSFGYTTVPPAQLGGDRLIDRFEELAPLVGI